tara:strand:+ start:324 stop:923 length:600 start_codon:yes stop_codon:yes gene_type:complete
MKIMIDMFSGLGGASEAFITRYDWQVFRFDNNPLLKDIEDTQITDNMFNIVSIFPGEVELLWASPPCREFSHGYNSPISRSRRGEIGYENFTPSLDLVNKTIEVIDRVKPKFWVIENVVGAISWLEPILGKPTQIIGSVVLWGNFPFIHMPHDFKERKQDKDTWSTDPLRANKKAKIPYEISLRLMIAVEQQRTLLEWV